MIENENKPEDNSGSPEATTQPTTSETQSDVAAETNNEGSSSSAVANESTGQDAREDVAEPAPLPSAARPKHNPHCELDNKPVSPNTTIPDRNSPRFFSAQQLRIGESLTTFPVDIVDMEHLGESYKAVDMTRSEEQRNWLGMIGNCYKSVQMNGAFLGSLNREESNWRQSVHAGGEKLQAGVPQFSEGIAPGDRLSGDRARMRIQALLKLGQSIRVPLWHSGIWLTLKAPTEAALLELERRVSNEKIRLGRETQGLAFSNSSVYINSYVVNFVLAHVFDSTVRYRDVEELKSIIKVTDIPLLTWGLLCTMYPSGYPHMQPCVKDPSKCAHIVEELISIGRLLWTDERALSEKQRQHMKQKTAKFNVEELAFYEKDHAYHAFSTLNAFEGLSIELKVPTIREFEQAGFEWVDSIVSSTDAAFGGTMKGDERLDYIDQSAQTTLLRSYAHYVERIVINGVEIIDDRSTIEDTLGTLTSNDEVYRNFFDGVQKFIDRSTLALIAIPKYDCPACGPAGDEDVERTNPHPYLIPLDVVSVFFTLIDQRLLKVLTKSPIKS